MLPSEPNQKLIDAVSAALLRGRIGNSEAKRLTNGAGFTEYLPDPCPVAMEGFHCEFHSYPADGQCICGTYKHHVHCEHGYVIQWG